MKSNPIWFSLGALASVLLLALPAKAQPDYPLAMKEHLTLSYAPPCSVCHAKGNPGAGTVTTPFGWALRGQGLDGEDMKTVAESLDGMKRSRIDSDGDRVTDIDELGAGTDPNSPGKVPMPNGEEPGYGCGSSAPDPSSPEASLLLTLPWMFGLVLRRRRPHSGTQKRNL